MRYFLFWLHLLSSRRCSSALRIETLHAPDLNLSGYPSFAFVEPLGTDRGGYASLISQQFKFSICREMEKQGLKCVENTEQADLLVNAFTHLDKRIRTRQVSDPFMGPTYWDYRYGSYTAWPGYSVRTELQEYTEGTLTIDLIDYAVSWGGKALSRHFTTAYPSRPRVLPEYALFRLFILGVCF